jgi:hypothetical protein
MLTDNTTQPVIAYEIKYTQPNISSLVRSVGFVDEMEGKEKTEVDKGEFRMQLLMGIAIAISARLLVFATVVIRCFGCFVNSS